MKELPHYLAVRLSQIDYEREMCLILCEPGPPGESEIYGVISISADPNNERAEYAITVRDDMTGLGLGTFLMRRIIEYATGRGIRRIYGHVLAENVSMLDICRRLGFSVARAPDESDVLLASLELPVGADPQKAT
jgi:acetyltransferase